MKIGMVINSSWNIYNFRRGLVKFLLSQGHQIVAIAPDDGYAEHVISLGCEFVHVNMSNKGVNPFQDIQLVRDLYKVYKEQNLQAVLHYTIKPNIYGSLAAAMLGIPSVNNVTGLGTVFIKETFKTKVARLLYRQAFKYPKNIFFQNEDDLTMFVHDKLVNPRVADVLPGSGIDLEHHQPIGRKRNKTFTFLMVARALYDKGLVEYVEAIKILKKEGLDVKFQLLGAIEKEDGYVPIEKMESWVNEGLLEFFPKTNDVRPFIDQADCVVLPSYREGTPKSLIEAASHAKPIITTDVPGCRETVKHDYNGYLCQVKSPQDLASKMKRMVLLEPRRLAEMGRNSRALAESKFDEKIIFQKYAMALNVCSKQRTRANRELIQKFAPQTV